VTDKTINDLTSASGTVAADLIELWDASASATVKDTITNVVGAVTIGVTKGGTGLTSTTAGDILYADASNSIAKLAKSATTSHALLNTGASNVPAWGQVILTSGVTGSLPVANGGTAATDAPTALTNLGITHCRLTGTFDPASATLQNVTGMSFSVLNTHYYQGRFHLIFQTATTTTGPFLSITRPTGNFNAAMRVQHVALATISTGVGVYEQSIGVSGSGAAFADAPTINVNLGILVEFTFQCTADGTLQLQFANETGTTDNTLRAGSTGICFDLGT
jgi:hypothetical protein